jgi:hypothetical protein
MLNLLGNRMIRHLGTQLMKIKTYLAFVLCSLACARAFVGQIRLAPTSFIMAH